jgi:hypothetical protein
MEQLAAWIQQDDRDLFVAGLLLFVSASSRLGNLALYPLRLTGTWAHEVSHALAGLLVGGRVNRIELFRDGSGVAWLEIPPGRLRAGLVYSAGYLGSALCGAALLACREAADIGRLGLGGMGLAMLLTVLLWVRNLLGVVAITLVGGLFLLGAWKLWYPWNQLLYTTVGLGVGMDAVTRIRALVGRTDVRGDGEHRPTDAAQVARVWGGRHWMWAMVWLLASFCLLLTGIQLGGGPEIWTR